MEKISQDKFKRIPIEDKSAEFLARPKVTYWQDAFRRFKKNRLALIAGIILIILALYCIFGPMITYSKFGYTLNGVTPEHKNMRPGKLHWFGADNMGRDIFTRAAIGGRVSLIIGIAGAFIVTIIGSIYGAISAYAGGRIDNLMMRIVEIIGSIPYLLIVILIQLWTDSKSIGTMLFAMTVTGWGGMARMVRGQLISLKNQDFILAAEVLGVSTKEIIFKHLIPNTLNIILISISFDIPGFIFSEAFLSYLGLGIQSPNTSWGALASAAQQVFIHYPYQLIAPGMMIALTMLSFTLLGDGLRDALDPKLRE